MQKLLNHKYRNVGQLYFALLCIVCMFLGMLIARALTGIAMVCFCVNGILFYTSINKLKALFKNYFYWGGAILFLIVFVSGFWGGFNAAWQYSGYVKLPFVVLPIGFFALQHISKKQYQYLILSICFLLFLGTCYSLIAFWLNATEILNNYNKAKVIPVPFDGNHIYFSFTIVALVIFLLNIIINAWHTTLIYISAFFIFWFTIYLHILAAKTGVVLLYFVFFIHIIYFVFTSKYKLWFIGLLVFTMCLPIIFYNISPTFKTRIAYIKYDYFVSKSTNLNTQGLSDGSRWRSILAGVHIVNNNKILGVGAGQIIINTNNWYNINTPNILLYERMQPSSQFLWYLCCAGVFGLLAFSFYTAVFFIMPKQLVGWYCLAIIIIVFLSYEIGHEGQYGVLVIALLPWLWKASIKK